MWAFLAVFLLAPVPALLDERLLSDAVPIEKIVASPQNYPLRSVTVQGHARYVIAVAPPTAQSCTPSQQFELDTARACSWSIIVP